MLCLILSACGNHTESGRPSDVDSSDENAKVERKQELEESSSNDQPASAAPELLPPETSLETTYLYHSDARIEQLLSAYNEIAEYPISPDMVSSGAYDFAANISCNGVFIIVTVSGDHDLFVDYRIEAKGDSAIKPLFRDFCKSLNSEINDEDIETAWSALQTKEYKNYNRYKFKGIECTYTASAQLSNGTYRFIVKTSREALD